ncbi:MAG: HIT family protein [Acidimicrobiia bacterium]
MDGKSSCKCCSIVDELGRARAVFPMGAHWTVNARIRHERPGLVVQSRLHRESMADLDAAEREDLGRVLAVATRYMESLPGVEKVYVSLWNEGFPSHVHFHLIPRCTSDLGAPLGPGLADIHPSEFRADTRDVAMRVSQLASLERVERSRTVLLALATCQSWSRVSLYRFASR